MGHPFDWLTKEQNKTLNWLRQGSEGSWYHSPGRATLPRTAQKPRQRATPGMEKASRKHLGSVLYLPEKAFTWAAEVHLICGEMGHGSGQAYKFLEVQRVRTFILYQGHHLQKGLWVDKMTQWVPGSCQ